MTVIDPNVRRDRILNAMCCALIAIIVCVAFGRLFHADFTNWDDAHTIKENPDFQPPTFKTFIDLWARPRAHLYVPVTYSTWWVLSKASYGKDDDGHYSQNAHVFHAANIALHLGAACAVFAALRRLLIPRLDANRARWCAMIGALLFALHPVQVEPVAWVSGLKDVLCGLLCAIALWQYIVYAQTQTTRAYVLCCVAFVLAMLSKPTAVMFPVLALAVDVFFLRRPLIDIVRGIVPLALFAAPGVALAAYVQQAEGVTTTVAVPWRPLVALDALSFYLHKIVWPAHLSLDYGRSQRAVIASGQWRYAFILPCLVAGMAIAVRKRLPEVVAGAIIFLAMLLPVLGLKRFDFQEYSTVADHYLYMPMIGVALIAAGLLARLPKAAIPFAFVLCVALGTRANDQTRHWMNSESLWTHTIQRNPNSWVSYLNLGEYYSSINQPERAEEYLLRSVKLRDNDPAHLNLGVIYLERQDIAAAIREFERAIALNPRSGEAHTNLANAYLQVARFGSAIKEFEIALKLNPKNEKAARMLPQVREFVRTHQVTSRPTTSKPVK